MCEAGTCSDCLQLHENCAWSSQADLQCSWSGPTVPNQPMHAQTECDEPCEQLTTCTACLYRNQCSWSSLLDKCLSSSATSLFCARGVCGALIEDSAGCPRDQCEDVTYCGDCLKLSYSCGWYGMDDGSGRGYCKRGNLLVSVFINKFQHNMHFSETRWRIPFCCLISKGSHFI